MRIAQYVSLAIATAPFFYYLIVIYSAVRYFRQPARATDSNFTPPVSNLKPIRGLDPQAYENLASFCVQDYPDYEILFCVDRDDSGVVSVAEQIQQDFPNRRIRILYGSDLVFPNDKVARLVRLVGEAQHEILVISDSDVRVKPDYLRRIVSRLNDPGVGAVTCFYVPTEVATFADRLQAMGMISDFYPGILADRQLEGIKFALGPTIATTRSHLCEFGGYEVLANRPADDLLVGRLIAERGREVVLLPYTIETVPDYNSFGELLHKRLRWMVVMRHMRPRGHFGLLMTQGLPWSLAAAAIYPAAPVAAIYFSLYVVLRILMTWIVGVHGLKQRRFWKEIPLIPLWDATAFGIWLASFLRTSIRWRGVEYDISGGELVRLRQTCVRQDSVE
jgi:ceramide glucosyltransferase